MTFGAKYALHFCGLSGRLVRRGGEGVGGSVVGGRRFRLEIGNMSEWIWLPRFAGAVR